MLILPTLNLVRNLGKANFTRLSVPAKLNFAVTYRCQYRCQTCNIWKKKPKDELTTDEMLEFVRRNTEFGWVDVTGGEIFLREDIGDILQAMVTDWKQLAILHFPTNGFQTDRIVDITEKVAAGFDGELVVTVSLDGPEALNDTIRGIKGGFRRQIETFRRLRELSDARVVLGMTLSDHNVGQFESTFQSCRTEIPDLELNEFHVNVMQISGHYYSNEDRENQRPATDLAVRDIRRYLKLRGRSWAPGGWLERAYLTRVEKFLRTGKTPMTCHSLRSSCFIDPWGTVFPCITYSKPVGRLRDTRMDLAPIWEGMAATGLQGEIWAGDCPQCWTACEAYQSIVGNVMRPGAEREVNGRLNRQTERPPVHHLTNDKDGVKDE